MHDVDQNRGNIMFRNYYSSTLTPLALLCLLSFVASSPMLPGGWFNSHEGIAPIERVLALSYEIKNGDYYPRWLSSAYQSQGLPFFNFYSPMFYLLAAYLYSFGLPLLFAIKLVIWLLFFAGSTGMFFWVKRHCGATGGLISAITYLFLPYHFLDIYVRGAMAEFAALAILPFLFCGIDLSFSERAFKGILITGISSALLVLTHNLSALMIFPFAAVYFFCMAASERLSRERVIAAFAGPVIGLGLSSFYWLPVIMEKEYLGSFSSLTSGSFDYANHFTYPSQWVSTHWGFGVSAPGLEDTLSFQLGFALLLLLVISLGCLVFSKERRFGIMTLALGLFGLFMTTSPSSAIYGVLSPLHYVQFPWRFLGPATMFLAAFAGLAAGLSYRLKILKSVYLILLSLLLSVFLSGEQRAVSGRMQIGNIANEYIFKGRLIGQLSMVNEYLPKWAEGSIYPSTLPRPVSGYTVIEEVEARGSYTSFVTSGRAKSGVMIPQFFFPGWKAEIDGLDTAVTPGEKGFLLVEVPSGKHKVEVWFGTTLPRLAGWSLSILTVIAIVAIRLKRKSRNLFSSHE